MDEPQQPQVPSTGGPQQPEGKGVPTRKRVLGIFVAAVFWSLVLGAMEHPASMEARVGFAGLIFLLIPLQAIRGYYHLKRGLPLPHKHQRYFVAIFAQGALLAVASIMAYELAPQWFHPVLGSADAILLAGVMAAAAMIGTYRKWKLPGGMQRPLQMSLLPVTMGEVILWTFVSLLAGTAEEIAYRGVAVTLALRWTGSLPLAWGVGALAFGLAHVPYGGRAAVGTAVFGLTMQVVFFLTGTLYLPMLTHALYDLLLGVMFIWMNRQPTAQGATASA